MAAKLLRSPWHKPVKSGRFETWKGNQLEAWAMNIERKLVLATGARRSIRRYRREPIAALSREQLETRAPARSKWESSRPDAIALSRSAAASQRRPGCTTAPDCGDKPWKDQTCPRSAVFAFNPSTLRTHAIPRSSPIILSSHHPAQ
jgi:hypothetical protein